MAHTSTLAAPHDPDFLIREPDAEYRNESATHLSSHALAEFRKCPLLYWKRKQGLVPDEDRPAYVVGRAAHKLILEGRKAFDHEYAVGGPVNLRTGEVYGVRTKAYQEWAEAQGKPVITDDQFALIANLATGVQSHPLAFELLSSGLAEGVARTEYCDMPCQARVDWFKPDCGLVDLKTCDDLTWFESDARRYGYAYQMAFYQAVIEQVSGDPFPVHMIAVEKKEPFRSGVWLMSEQTLIIARRESEAAIERLKQCELTGAWPTGYEERRVFDSL